MKELKRVNVTGAPGLEDFLALEYERIAAVDDRGDLSLIIDLEYEGEMYVVPSKYVTYVTP